MPQLSLMTKPVHSLFITTSNLWAEAEYLNILRISATNVLKTFLNMIVIVLCWQLLFSINTHQPEA